jgi:hypothetical protein
LKVHTKIKYLLLFFVLIAASASAQKNLVVYHVTGNVNIVSGNRSSVAKRGDILTKKNSLQVKQGADCMLIDEKGKSLQVNSAGTYTFDVLQKMMSNAGNTGVTQKFFSYVYDNLFSGKKGDKLSITPVVFRGDELMKTPADNIIIISDAFTLGWKNPSGKIWGHVIIKDSADKIIVDTVIKRSASLQINIAENNLQSGYIYKWKVEESGTRQHTENYFHFLIAGKNDRKQILKDLKLLQDKNMSNNLKLEMQQDIFLKWEQYYLQKT